MEARGEGVRGSLRSRGRGISCAGPGDGGRGTERLQRTLLSLCGPSFMIWVRRARSLAGIGVMHSAPLVGRQSTNKKTAATTLLADW